MNFLSKIFSFVFSFIFSLISKLFILLEFFLFLRLLLKFLGASSVSLAVSLVHQYSDIFVSPFKFIFPNFYWQGHLIEIATVCAMAGYLLAMFVLAQLAKIFEFPRN